MRFSQPSKVKLGTVFKLDGYVNVEIPVQPEKTPSPIDVTEFGIVISLSSLTTLVSASTFEKGNKLEVGSNLEAAKGVGALIAQRAIEKGITEVVFDRGGFLFHGRIKALADAAREAGLKF